MDILIKISAGIMLTLCTFVILLYPAVIGKPKGNFSYSGWIMSIFQTILIILMAGRIFGWF